MSRLIFIAWDYSFECKQATDFLRQLEMKTNQVQVCIEHVKPLAVALQYKRAVYIDMLQGKAPKMHASIVKAEVLFFTGLTKLKLPTHSIDIGNVNTSDQVREAHMTKQLSTLVKKSSGTIVAIIGAMHIEPIIKQLKIQGINVPHKDVLVFKGDHNMSRFRMCFPSVKYTELENTKAGIEHLGIATASSSQPVKDLPIKAVKPQPSISNNTAYYLDYLTCGCFGLWKALGVYNDNQHKITILPLLSENKAEMN